MKLWCQHLSCVFTKHLPCECGETRPLVIFADPGRLWDRQVLYTWPRFFASLRGYEVDVAELERRVS